MKGGRVRGVEAEGAETEGENQWVGAESEGLMRRGGVGGENQRGPSQRGGTGPETISGLLYIKPPMHL